MDLTELDAAFARLGLPSTHEQMRARRQWIVRGPWQLVQDIDRGDDQVTTFAGEDELCRHLLSRALVHADIAPARRPAEREGHSAVAVDATPAPPAPTGGGAPVLRWRLPLAPFTRVSARGAGLVVLENTAAVHERGSGGALLLTAIDVESGQERWSVPVPPREPTVGLAGDVVLTWSRGELAAVELAGGQERWRVAFEPRPALLASSDGVAALGLDGNPLRSAVGLSLATGETRWERTVTNPRFTAEPDRATGRLLRAEPRGDRLLLTRVSVADGEERRLLDVPLPPGYAGAQLVVIADHLEERETAGLVLIRGRATRTPGTVGTPMGDLVLRPGEQAALVLDERPVARVGGGPDEGHFASGADGRHLLLVPHSPDEQGTSLLAVGEGIRWTRPGWTRLLTRRPGLTVVTGRSARRGLLRTRHAEVVGVEDDGRVRWRRLGMGVLARADEAWIQAGSELIGVGVEDGEPRWTGPVPQPTPTVGWRHPNGLEGYRDADRHLILARPDTREAYG